MSSTPLLQINNLHLDFKVYGGRLKVLDGVNFMIRPGEKVGLVGETGSGKTTMMKAILRVLPQPPAMIHGGGIFFKGKNLLEMSRQELMQVRGRGISMIFQDPTAALNPVFTIGEQLKAVVMGPSIQTRRMSKEEMHENLIKPLRDVALADPDRLLNSYLIQLSGGMRQRVCIAMALSTSPELLIADEPGTSLDVTIQDQVLRLLHNLVESKNMAVILITHSLGVVREGTDRVCVMYAGNIVEEASTGELYRNPSHPYTQGLMSSVPKLSGGGVSDGIPGHKPGYLNPPTGCRFHPRCQYVMDICRHQKPQNYKISDTHTVACFKYQEFGLQQDINQINVVQ